MRQQRRLRTGANHGEQEAGWQSVQIKGVFLLGPDNKEEGQAQD
jgi:hypothetical protein